MMGRVRLIVYLSWEKDIVLSMKNRRSLRVEIKATGLGVVSGSRFCVRDA